MRRTKLQRDCRNLTFRMPVELDRKLTTAAEQSARTISDEVRIRLEHSISAYPRLVLQPAPAE